MSMNTKSSWILLAMIILAVIMVPLIPNDAPLECRDETSCDDAPAYVSVYTKYLSK